MTVRGSCVPFDRLTALALAAQAPASDHDRQLLTHVSGCELCAARLAELTVQMGTLRDAADADEAVQDAFIKVFLHIEQYREELPFDVWFMRILVNACLDRLKSRSRQQRWIAEPSEDALDERPVEQAADGEPSSEHKLLAKERWQQVIKAVATLPDRQKLVFTLSHIDERTAAEISEATGMSPATVRVHLFRAIRKLRTLLGEQK